MKAGWDKKSAAFRRHLTNQIPLTIKPYPMNVKLIFFSLYRNI